MATLLWILLPGASFADEVCVVEAAIGHEDGRWTYMTGVGPDGATPIAIEPKKEADARILQEAARDMKADVKVCMVIRQQGAVRVVTSARLESVGPFEQRRCGWVDNPTPGNWSLTDKDGDRSDRSLPRR